MSLGGFLPPALLEIQVIAGEAIAKMQEVNAELATMEAQATKTGGSLSLLDKIGVSSGVALAAAGAAVVSFGAMSVKAAMDAQTAFERLNTGLQAAGIGTEENRKKAEELAAANTKLGFTTVGTANALGSLVMATHNMRDSQQLLNVAMDLARAKHMGLADAATALARGSQGSARAFKEFGITLDTTLPKQDAINKAMDELQKRVQGQAIGYTKTFSGQIAALGAQAELLAEKIGNVLIPILSGMLSWLQRNGTTLLIIAGILSTVLIPFTVQYTKKLIEQAAAFAAANWEITAVVAGIALLVVAFKKAWEASDTFRQIVIDAVNAVLGIVSWLVQALIKVGQAFLNYLILPLRAVLEIAAHVGPWQDQAKAALGFIDTVNNGFDSAQSGVNKFFLNAQHGMQSLKNASSDTAKEVAKAGGASGFSLTGYTGANIIPRIAQSPGARAANSATKLMESTHASMLALQNTYNDSVDKAEATFFTKSAAAYTTFNDTKAKLQDTYDKTSAAAVDAYNKSVAAAQDTYDKSAEKAQQAHTQKLLNITTQYQDKLNAIIQASKDQLTSAWASGVDTKVTTMFDALVKKGDSSAQGLLTAMKDRLGRVQELAANAAKLAGLGFSQTFIEQVVAAGPDQGNALAKSILGSDGSTQAQLRDTFNQMNALTNTGMNTLADTMYQTQGLANDKLKQQYVDTQSAMADALAKENMAYTATMAQLQQTLDDAMLKAATTRDAALAAAQKAYQDGLAIAQKTLDDNLTKANDALQVALIAAAKKWDDGMSKLEASFKAKSESIKTMAASTAAAIANMMAQLSASQSASQSALVNATVAQSQQTGTAMSAPAYAAGQTYVHYELNTTAQTNASPSQIASDVMVALQNGTPLSAAGAGYLTRRL